MVPLLIGKHHPIEPVGKFSEEPFEVGIALLTERTPLHKFDVLL